ncbi:MAG: hypothetical protein LBK72_02070 [Bifidobacteriaceae bacterium]|nr:hypothetical protein [Bifidobacteriaceae bacterium]
MAPRRFDVVVRRDGRWWVFEIPELGTGGQARDLAEVEYEARGVAAMWLDVPPQTVGVIVSVEGQDEALAAWAAAQRAEVEGRRAQAAAAAQRHGVVAALRAAGYSALDTARLLGISKQRVYQIAPSKTLGGGGASPKRNSTSKTAPTSS